MKFTSFDQLAESVLIERVVVVETADLLGFLGRQRATTVALDHVANELLQRRLETHPQLGKDVEELRVFRRDSGVAAVFDSVARPSPHGDRQLARLWAAPDDGIATDLSDLLRLTESRTLQDLSDGYVYSFTDEDTWVSFPGEDEWTFNSEHGRQHGIRIHTMQWNIDLKYPFQIHALGDAASELEQLTLLSWSIDELYEIDGEDESQEDYEEVDAAYILNCLLVCDVSRPRHVHDRTGGKADLELVEREDGFGPALARFLPSREILFRLTPEDVADRLDSVRITNRDPRSKMRIASDVGDGPLAYELMRRAYWKLVAERSK